eukprot:COSAG01_NODE_104_length_26171_cov_96.617612_10_plen_163_part_00
MIGQQSTVTLQVTNPFTHRPLTGVRLRAEGRRLMADLQELPMPDIAAGGSASVTIQVTPSAPRRAPRAYQLTASLHCNELEGIQGVFRIEAGLAPGEVEEAVSRPFPSWNRSILIEIYLCHTCSCQAILRTETAGQEPPEMLAAAAQEVSRFFKCCASGARS